MAIAHQVVRISESSMPTETIPPPAINTETSVAKYKCGMRNRDLGELRSQGYRRQ